MKYQIFGETSELSPDSIYTYANSFSLNLLKLLGEDDRFLDINQADLLNIALSLFMTCIMQYNNPRMAKYFRQVLLDYEEFKEFISYLMIDGRIENRKLVAKLSKLDKTTDPEELESLFRQISWR